MKSYYCKRLYEEINFDAEQVYVCCGKSLGPSFDVPSKNEQENDYKKYLNKLISWRKSCSINAYFGNISKKCQNCVELEQRQITLLEYLKVKFGIRKNVFQLKNIIIKSFRQCEFSCAYCLEKKYTKGKKTLEISKSEFYDFLPILDELIKKKMINNKDLRIEFQGGSISVWDEFIKTLKKVKDIEVAEILYHSNAFKYIPEISETAKKINSGMSISIDAGCKETYKKIKGVDCFDTVIENIVKYANSNINCSIKYIIVKNLNDNMDEIKLFCDTIDYIYSKVVDKSKINIMLDIDFRDSLFDKNYQIPEEYIKMYKQLKEYCSQKAIHLGLQDFIQKKLVAILNY